MAVRGIAIACSVCLSVCRAAHRDLSTVSKNRPIFLEFCHMKWGDLQVFVNFEACVGCAGCVCDASSVTTA